MIAAAVTDASKIHSASSFGWSPATKKAFATAYRSDPEYRSTFLTPALPYRKMDGLLFLESENALLRLCVPNSQNNQLRTNIFLSEFHDSDISAHPGIRRTFLRISQWYYWKTLQQDVQAYVQSCETCTRWKHNNAKKKGMMIPIPIPKECWEVVSMDFVTGLPVSDGYDAIMTVVDKLSKRAKYCVVNTTDDAEKTANHFFDCVIRHHGVPSIIISDRDPKFISQFWTSLAQLMGIKLNMATAHRAQADGQTERQNLVLEDALRCMISSHGNNWASKLGTIEYAHATLTSASTGFSPFELDTGRKERHPFGSILPPGEVNRTPTNLAEYAKTFMDHKQEIIERARKELVKTQERQKKYYEQKRSSVTFKTGDLVMLDTRRLPLRHSTQALDEKRAKIAARKIGPYEIERMVNDNVAKLKLPRNTRFLHSAFNVDILSHYVENPDQFPTRPIPKASRVILDTSTGDEMHIVEKLLKKRQFNRQPEWLVKWHGLPDHEATWEREKDIRHVAHWKVLVDLYKMRQREVKSGRM